MSGYSGPVLGAMKYWKTCENCGDTYNPKNNQGGRKYCDKCRGATPRKHNHMRIYELGSPINKSLAHLSAINEL